MSTAVIVMVAVMAFASIGMMFIAIIEFVMYMRNSRKEQQPIVITAPAVAQPEPIKEPEPVKEEPVAQPETPLEVVSEVDENSVTFELAEAHRPTIKEAYEGLKKIEQELYDKIIAAANELEMARVIESTYAVTIMQGRDNIGKLRILRGVVTLDCTVINPDLVKYNKENGTVDVIINESKSKVNLTVRDTGIGIPQGEQSRVFERFYRVDKSHSKFVGGTGLGLAIVKHGAAYHDADVFLESTDGKGTSVTISFRK